VTLVLQAAALKTQTRGMQPTELGPRRQRGGTSRRPAYQAAAVGSCVVAVGGTISALAYAGAPWWAMAFVAVILAALGSGVALAQLMLPQKSRDRLDWWRDHRRHRVQSSRSSSALHIHRHQAYQRPVRGCAVIYCSTRSRIPKHHDPVHCGGPLPCLGPMPLSQI
jgi:hypothetical protein